MDASSGFLRLLRVVSSRRRVGSGARLAASQSAGDGWCSQRWTSRCSARATRTCSRAGEMRVAPKIDSRSGSGLSSGWARSWAQVSSSSSAGLGVCEVIAEGPPEGGLPGQVVGQRGAVALLVPAGGPGAEHLGPRLPVRVERPGQLGGGGQPPALLVVAEVLGERRAPRLVAGGLDDLEQRPGQACGRPRLHARGVLRGDGLGGVVEHPVGRREQDVGAHPVAVLGARAHAPTAAPTTAQPPWRARLPAQPPSHRAARRQPRHQGRLQARHLWLLDGSSAWASLVGAHGCEATAGASCVGRRCDSAAWGVVSVVDDKVNHGRR